jgi:light-regulated signal transduction histidine kinase (bacteriophytochrome)
MHTENKTGISSGEGSRHEQRISEQQLEQVSRDHAMANKELESFAYSLSHDIRAPLRVIDGFSQLLLADYGARLDTKGKEYLDRIHAGSVRMNRLIDDLLYLLLITRQEIIRQEVDLSAIVTAALQDIQRNDPQRSVDCTIREHVCAFADFRLVQIALQHLLGNAWKFTRSTGSATIEFGIHNDNGSTSFFVKDNGVGFDMKYASKLFQPFQRLHSQEEFEGTGIGLAIVDRVIRRHGGTLRTYAEPGKGATFYFTVGQENT